MSGWRGYRQLKYGNTPTNYDGIRFSSKLESECYKQLKLELAGKEITELTLQPVFPLAVNGKHICTYISDFMFFRKGKAQPQVWDAKGFQTGVNRLKVKLAKILYPDYEFSLWKKSDRRI